MLLLFQEMSPWRMNKVKSNLITSLILVRLLILFVF